MSRVFKTNGSIYYAYRMFTMKIHPFTTLKAGFAAMMIAPAFAIEAPADDAAPPPDVGAPAGIPKPKAAQAEAQAGSAFLGVVSSALPEMLAGHLGLKAGEGILVGALMPDGPAAKAGIAVHDVITRVAGQAVGSSLELTRQVATHQPGESLQLQLIHDGKIRDIKVTLGTRPAGLAAMDPRPLDPLHLDGMPKDLADRIRDAIEGNLGKFDIDDETAKIAPQMQNAMREMKMRMAQAMEGLDEPQIPGTPGIKIPQGATIRLMDEQGSIELNARDGGKEVTLRDKDNHITWNGPWDTDQDKAAAPEQVRQRVERLRLDPSFQGNGLRLNLNDANPPEK